MNKVNLDFFRIWTVLNPVKWKEKNYSIKNYEQKSVCGLEFIDIILSRYGGCTMWLCVVYVANRNRFISMYVCRYLLSICMISKWTRCQSLNLMMHKHTRTHASSLTDSSAAKAEVNKNWKQILCFSNRFENVNWVVNK